MTGCDVPASCLRTLARCPAGPPESLPKIVRDRMLMPPSAPRISAIRMAALPRILAVASFLIYAATIFALPQVRDSRYCCEQSSFAAAVSDIVYGSRIGSMYTGVFDLFITHSTEPLPQMLKEVRAELPAEPAGQLSSTTLDGNGVGYPVVATVAFRVFGFHWWAPIAVMLILMAVSMAAFIPVSKVCSGRDSSRNWRPGWRLYMEGICNRTQNFGKRALGQDLWR